MKNVLQPKDLRLSDFPERGDIAAWVDECCWEHAIPSYSCSACHEHTQISPTHYCSNCGAIMVNFSQAYENYQKAIEIYRTNNAME